MYLTFYRRFLMKSYIEIPLFETWYRTIFACLYKECSSAAEFMRLREKAMAYLHDYHLKIENNLLFAARYELRERDNLEGYHIFENLSGRVFIELYARKNDAGEESDKDTLYMYNIIIRLEDKYFTFDVENFLDIVSKKRVLANLPEAFINTVNCNVLIEKRNVPEFNYVKVVDYRSHGFEQKEMSYEEFFKEYTAFLENRIIQNN